MTSTASTQGDIIPAIATIASVQHEPSPPAFDTASHRGAPNGLDAAGPVRPPRSGRDAWRTGALLATVACLSGCASASDGATPTGTTARVIVRFEPDAGDANDRSFLEALARSARVQRIELIRPMSGDSYVMRVTCGDPTDRTNESCDAAIARIRAVRPVAMIEIDGRETIR